jgi:hypothetical protein
MERAHGSMIREFTTSTDTREICRHCVPVHSAQTLE